MEHSDLFRRLVEITDEILRNDKENPIDIEDPDPRFVQLLAEGRRIKDELDPLVRATFRSRPNDLAEWNKLVQAFENVDKLEKEWGGESGWTAGSKDEEKDARIAEARASGERAVNELDPIVRETFRDDPKALAEWDSIMQDWYKIDEMEKEGTDGPDS